MMLAARSRWVVVSVILISNCGQKILMHRFLSQMKQAELDRGWIERWERRTGGRIHPQHLNLILLLAHKETIESLSVLLHDIFYFRKCVFFFMRQNCCLHHCKKHKQGSKQDLKKQ